MHTVQRSRSKNKTSEPKRDPHIYKVGAYPGLSDMKHLRVLLIGLILPDITEFWVWNPGHIDNFACKILNLGLWNPEDSSTNPESH